MSTTLTIPTLILALHLLLVHKYTYCALVKVVSSPENVQTIDEDQYLEEELRKLQQQNGIDGKRRRRDVADTGSRLSIDTAIQIVEAHEIFRKRQPASNMDKMTWDNSLATMAQAWADACVYEHPLQTRYAVGGDLNLYNVAPVGQNLFATTGTVNVLIGIQFWYDEITDYDYNTNTCTAVCGHYTQVVWHDSIHVGCAIAVCPSGLQTIWPGTPAEYYVCNYGPAGNGFGELPYALGPPCTKCHLNSRWCADEALCTASCDGESNCGCKRECANCGTTNSDCTCSCAKGWFSDDCSVECKDNSPHCNGNGWPKDWCRVYSFVDNGCPATCGYCVPLAEDEDPVTCEGCWSLEIEQAQRHCYYQPDCAGFEPNITVSVTNALQINMACFTEQGVIMYDAPQDIDLETVDIDLLPQPGQEVCLKIQIYITWIPNAAHSLNHLRMFTCDEDDCNYEACENDNDD